MTKNDKQPKPGERVKVVAVEDGFYAGDGYIGYRDVDPQTPKRAGKRFRKGEVFFVTRGKDGSLPSWVQPVDESEPVGPRRQSVVDRMTAMSEVTAKGGELPR